MDGIKHSGRFAEMERLVSDYFRVHIAPVMTKTQAYLTEKQGEEMKAYSTSLGGILSMMASSAQPMNDPYQVLKVTGEWNSKTTEDYIEMCKTEITGSEAMQQDLAYMAGQWRDAIVQEIGRERYDELSERLGGDLAYAYMDYRVEELMIDKLVKERMPKSSVDYIIRKAAESSLLGLSQTLNRSPLAEEIEKRGEAAYRPGKIEKGAGWVLGTAADTVMLGGVGSWATLAKFVGADVAISAVADHLESQEPEPISAEQCISKGVFDSKRNVFDDFRREAAKIPVKKNATIIEANGQLKNKIPVPDFDFMEWMQERNMSFPWPQVRPAGTGMRAERYKDVPLVIAPGQEEAYLRDKARKSGTAEGEATVKSTKESQETEQREKVEKGERQAVITQEEKKQEEQPSQGNGNGWDGLFGTLGLNGMGDTLGNLGYVVAMLPDVLLGAFTGKSPSLRPGDNLLPIASIVAGIFVRNPLLKMLLIGMGGANLLNKAGHEALRGRTEAKINVNADNGNDVRYRRYADEPLNSRIVNPVLQGGTLVATIDRVPCTIQLSPTVADAYRAGALPLNTLANAVLAKSDQLRQTAAQNYDNGQQETIVRTRGIQ
ncbi:hypothetical protein [Parabacteroides distasonis]|uniref:hypothetical protein n=1 Tax=Parabacteroides distasonis TaxID=823 RepID=UPI00189FC8C9|nr:hypothetical protein [Parabacteroides distasonis]MDB9152682.1 hypothetical protein [Parabacteroides distasonis]MDB9157259.1 hypothetical protein [Parabacteroides distasonis]MDB9166273.1 hypothetical protein [Parabacteroides distasonis]MDB9170692.1 hypothetical protein [Parabacteroides distasonis]MDB9195251.1 hypothetical protein [Parabacteroides distasonis]